MIQSTKNIKIDSISKTEFRAKLKKPVTADLIWYPVLSYTLKEEKWSLDGLANWQKSIVLENILFLCLLNLIITVVCKKPMQLKWWCLAVGVAVLFKLLLTFTAILSTHIRVKNQLNKISETEHESSIL